MVYHRFFTINLSKYIIILIIFAFIFLGCAENIKKDVALMQSTPFKISMKDFVCIKSKYDTLVELPTIENMKIIVFSDSTVCSPCEIKSMNSWNHYIQLSQKSKGKLQLFFIFNQNKKNIKSLLYSLKEYFLHHPIYIDTIGIFQKDNPHLSKNPKLHTFLLDENNNVVLVGNPIKNSKIKELYEKIINQRVFYYPTRKDSNKETIENM